MTETRNPHAVAQRFADALADLLELNELSEYAEKELADFVLSVTDELGVVGRARLMLPAAIIITDEAGAETRARRERWQRFADSAADALDATAAEDAPESYESVRGEFVSALREFAAHPQTSEKMRDLATQWYTVIIKDDVRRAREQEMAEFEKLKQG